MIDLNPFFPQIKRLLKKYPKFREYGIELLKATLKFEISNHNFNFHLFDEEGEELVSLKIYNGITDEYNHNYDKNKVKEHLKKQDKTWVIIHAMHIRHTPMGAETSIPYTYSNGKLFVDGNMFNITNKLAANFLSSHSEGYTSTPNGYWFFSAVNGDCKIFNLMF